MKGHLKENPCFLTLQIELCLMNMPFLCDKKEITDKIYIHIYEATDGSIENKRLKRLLCLVI